MRIPEIVFSFSFDDTKSNILLWQRWWESVSLTSVPQFLSCPSIPPCPTNISPYISYSLPIFPSLHLGLLFPTYFLLPPIIKWKTTEETKRLADSQGNLTFCADIWALSLWLENIMTLHCSTTNPNLSKEQPIRRRDGKKNYPSPPLISLQITPWLLY